MPEFTITDYVPGAIGRVTELHADYYSRHWGFDLFFEAKVAGELAAFLQRLDPNKDGFWTVSMDGRIEGAIAIDGARAETEGAHLRWFILSDALRGKGIGNRLMEKAMVFCREKRHPRVFLWTFEGLHSARHLYEKYGFQLAEQKEGNQWGKRVMEQRFVLDLG